jgi:predicted HicB family RNase H-like nuclease
MATSQKRATVYFDPALHRALRIKAAETDQSLSDLVNEAVKLSLLEDAEDLAAFEERAGEPGLAFEEVVKDLRRSGAI